MKFILFNIVVAAGLVFLLTGTDDPVASSGRGVFSEAVLKATQMSDQVAQRLARAGSSVSPETPAPQTPAQAEAAPAKAAPPPLPPAIPVAPREARMVPGDADVAAPGGGLDPDVRQRRAEVLGEARRRPRVTVEEGGELMSPAERRRELDALVEQMELLYIGQIGG